MNKTLEEEFDIALASKNENQNLFDFGSCELTEPEIAEILIQENIFTLAFRKYRNNTFEMCSSLAEIEKILKLSGKFMEWYTSKGLTKDMISVLLKRWNLYIEFPTFKNKMEAWMYGPVVPEIYDNLKKIRTIIEILNLKT